MKKTNKKNLQMDPTIQLIFKTLSDGMDTDSGRKLLIIIEDYVEAILAKGLELQDMNITMQGIIQKLIANTPGALSSIQTQITQAKSEGKW